VRSGAAALVAATALVLPDAALASPGKALQSFVAAAGRGDSLALWRSLSAPSQKRLGPTYAVFRGRAALALAAAVGGFAHAKGLRVVVDERVDGTWGVAAVAGTRKARYAAYGVALRRTHGGWRVELGGTVRLTPVGNNELGAVSHAPAQLAVGVRSGPPIQKVGMWLDGVGFPLQAGGTGPSNITAYGVPPRHVGRGVHVLVAFASTDGGASASAWVFTVR